MSSGKRTNHDDQWNHDSLSKRARTLDNIQANVEEVKELPTSSTSSNNSNVTNYSSSQVDDSKQDDQIGSLFNFSGLFDIGQNALEEVNKPEITDEDISAAVDIPFEK